jgi:hypothetical protein
MSDSESVRAFARAAADAVITIHFAFIIFVALGGFLAWRWRRLVWLHVPVVLWGALIEFVGWTCPLTPLENHFRGLAGQSQYQGSFIEHHLLSLIYPVDYTLTLRVILGLLVVALNALAYGVYLRGAMRRRAAHDGWRPSAGGAVDDHAREPAGAGSLGARR